MNCCRVRPMPEIRALISGFPWEWQVEIVKNLHLKPVYWIAHGSCVNQPGLPGGVLFHDMYDAVSGKPASALKNMKFDYLPDSFFIEHAGFVDHVTRMFYIKQCELYDAELFVNHNNIRRLLYKMVSYWHHILKDFKIEFVLFESIPHEPTETIIHHLAKIYEIPQLFFHRIGEPNRFFLCDSFANLTPMSNAPADDNHLPDISPLKEAPAYAKFRKRRTLTAKTADNVKLLFKHPRRQIRSSKNAVRTKIKQYIFMREYRRLALKNLPSSKWIYFALNKQPEDTTYPVGGNFVDAIYAIEYLAELIPDDIFILVKEHPNQPVPNDSRYPGFYRQIASIRNVRLVNMEFRSAELIEHCIAVASVNGQVGWEGLTWGKPAITFSQPWYQTCPYVYHIEQIKQSPGLLRRLPIVDKKAISVWYKNLLESTCEGYTTQISKPSSRLTKAENISIVSEAINRRLAAINPSGSATGLQGATS